MIEAIWSQRGTIQLICATCVWVVAIRRGAGPERLMASIFLAIPCIDRLYHFIASDGHAIWSVSNYAKVDLGHFLIDAVALLAMATVAIRANRTYPLWIGGLQIVATFSHFTRAVMPHLHPVAYAIMERAPYYLQVALLIGGLTAQIVRTNRIGACRSWRNSSHQMGRLRQNALLQE